jgi:spore coat polysaccharide biosynthesis predicted glycosyltransferase SpsG
MRIAFVTKGGPVVGMGHIFRTITLAQEIQSTCEVLFITSGLEAVVETIEKNGYRVLVSSDVNDLVTKLVQYNPTCIVLDYPEIEEETTQILRETLDARIILFDSNSEANRNADIIVNPLIEGDFKNSRSTIGKTLYLKGPRYLVLRNEFHEDETNSTLRIESISKILLAFGGSDPLNLTVKYLKRIINNQRWTKIAVILGPAYNHSIDDIVSSDSRIDIHSNPKDIAALMKSCELIMTSPGLTVFEGLVLGRPVIAIPQNDLQRRVYQTLFEQHNKIPELLYIDEDAFYLSPNERKVEEMDLGQGREEVVALISKNP